QAQAQAWLTELGGDVDAFIARIAEYVRNEPYVYTLSPATLPELDSVDRFWFDTREGFCTHYAGATVLLLRAAGVPARMVGGYLGGAVNRITGHLEVRQYDAHAWVEYWLPQQGWLRFDPTAAVAPERIRSGLSAALSQEDRAQLSLFAAARFGGEGLVGTVLQWADSLEHRWNLFVVGFDASQQKGVLARLLGEVTPQRIVIGMLAGGGMCLALVSLVLFWRIRQPARPPLEAAFDALTQAAARVGVVRQADESPAAFLRRLAVVEEGGWESYGGTVEGLQQHFYDPTAEHDGAVLLRELRRWRLRLLLRRR
ncbi:MAG: transglutaminase-like domain-containing protein, partial [Pseudomonadota bacterium]